MNGSLKSNAGDAAIYGGGVSSSRGDTPNANEALSSKMANPHNPDFIMKKPWYLGGNTRENGESTVPTLEHQYNSQGK